MLELTPGTDRDAMPAGTYEYTTVGRIAESDSNETFYQEFIVIDQCDAIILSTSTAH